MSFDDLSDYILKGCIIVTAGMGIFYATIFIVYIFMYALYLTANLF